MNGYTLRSGARNAGSLKEYGLRVVTVADAETHMAELEADLEAISDALLELDALVTNRLAITAQTSVKVSAVKINRKVYGRTTGAKYDNNLKD